MRTRPFRCNQAGIGFVLIELDLGITFCQVGLTTREFARAERNAENARTAMRAVLHVKENLRFSAEERGMVSAKTSQLAMLLVQLERRLTALEPWNETDS
jgi:hypothetical protein